MANCLLEALFDCILCVELCLLAAFLALAAGVASRVTRVCTIGARGLSARVGTCEGHDANSLALQGSNKGRRGFWTYAQSIFGATESILRKRNG